MKLKKFFVHALNAIVVIPLVLIVLACALVGFTISLWENWRNR